MKKKRLFAQYDIIQYFLQDKAKSSKIDSFP